MAVDLSADLERLARAVHPARQRVQHASGITQARHSAAVQEMRVDARDLRRDVRAHAQHAARKLVDELERPEVQIVPRAGEQRIDVFEQRRHDELVAVHGEEIEHRAAQALDARRLRGQDVLDVLGQKPGTHCLRTTPFIRERGAWDRLSPRTYHSSVH